MTVQRQGGCLCGAVRYRVHGMIRRVVYCHCTMCRRSTGHYAAFTAADKTAVRIEDDSSLTWYGSSDSARRGFCRACGSSLFWDPRMFEYLCIAAGSFDDSLGLDVSHHIFVADRGAYYALCDGLPEFAGSMHGGEEPVDLWNQTEGGTNE